MNHIEHVMGEEPKIYISVCVCVMFVIICSYPE